MCSTDCPNILINRFDTFRFHATFSITLPATIFCSNRSECTENQQKCAGRGGWVWSPSSHLSDVSMSLTNSTNLDGSAIKTTGCFRYARMHIFHILTLSCCRPIVSGSHTGSEHSSGSNTILSFGSQLPWQLLYFKESCKDGQHRTVLLTGLIKQ